MKKINDYYPGKEYICAVLNGVDMIEDMHYYGKDENGMYHVCCDQFVFSEALDRQEIEDEVSNFEDYEILKQLGVKEFAIVLRKNIFSWDIGDSFNEDEDYESVIEDFNEMFGTEFTSLRDIFNYAWSEQDKEGNEYGLSLSLNFVADAEQL